jgi:hypothetical protein
MIRFRETWPVVGSAGFFVPMILDMGIFSRVVRAGLNETASFALASSLLNLSAVTQTHSMIYSQLRQWELYWQPMSYPHRCGHACEGRH